MLVNSSWQSFPPDLKDHGGEEETGVYSSFDTWIRESVMQGALVTERCSIS